MEAEVHLFTDGGCSGNPGPGGWGFVLRHLPSGKEMESSGAEPMTTNNRMELTAVIKGLEDIARPCRVELFTDSVYVGKGLSEWIAEMETERVAAEGTRQAETGEERRALATVGRAGQ